MASGAVVAQDLGAGKKRAFRGDIQALRAIAVVLVVLDHLVLLQKLPGHPEGGFIGVDVFFVISGFLITQHLVTEVLKTGRISFKEFYIRRARRILPMALLVIVVTILASFLVFWPWLAASYAVDGVWSALFVSNIAFAIRGVDYFSADQTSIFQHYWSLSVEEQFYLVWPVLIAAVAFFAFKRFRPVRALIIATSVVTLASFIYACVDTSLSPTAAYFSTISRGFEFGLGGVLAILTPRMARIPARLRPWLSFAGVAGIIVSIWVISPDAGFPGPAALLPVLAAVLYIAAGTGTEKAVQIWPLRTRPSIYIGSISYSLYLWHWPIIMIISALVPRDIVVVPAALALMFALSALSYRYVETPIGQSAWLRRSTLPRHFTRRAVLHNVTMMTVGIVVAAGLVVAGDGTVRAVTSSGSSASTAEPVEVQPGQPPEAQRLVDELQVMIEEGKARSDWSGLRPAVSDIGIYSGALAEECWTKADEEARTCLRGNADAPHTIVVFGDSIAMNAAFAVDRFVEDHPDWNLQVFAKLGCAAPEVPAAAPGGGPYESCDEFRAWAIERIREINPDAVWMTSALPRTMPGVESSEILDVWDRGLRATLEHLGNGSRTFVVMPPPAGEDLAFCSRPHNTPQDCGSTLARRWVDVRDISALAVEDTGATMVDTAMWFCDGSGACPAVIGDYIVRRDERHLTYEFGSFLAPLVAAWVTPVSG